MHGMGRGVARGEQQEAKHYHKGERLGEASFIHLLRFVENIVAFGYHQLPALQSKVLLMLCTFFALLR